MRLLGLVLLLVLAWPWSAWALPIRVALLESARTVELRGLAIQVTPLGGCDGCGGASWRTDVVQASVKGAAIDVAGHRASAFRLRSDWAIRLNGRDYQAPVDLVKNGDGIAVVNELPLEEYVAGVVRAEIGDRWPVEALKAQAIVARTYAAFQRSSAADRAYHIVASTAHQAFLGHVPPSSPIWGAVIETTGQVLLLEGELFPAFYHAESGGYTEDPRLVFAARNMPPLRALRDEFSNGSPHFYWNLDVRLSDLAELLRRNQVGVGRVTGIEVTERTTSLRVVSLTIQGTGGSVRLRGADFRRMLGYENLRSTIFAVTIDGDAARFSGRGYGHGVGMSQWGARTMAEQGYTARQILEYYYPNAKPGTLAER